LKRVYFILCCIQCSKNEQSVCWRRCLYVGGCCVCLSRPTREELDAITMNPIRTTTDLQWLESHVRTVCGGQLPPLVGPYAIPHLVSQLEGMRKHFGY